MPPPASDYREWNENDWKNWLDERLKERRNVFTSDPDEVVASYNRENTWADAYAGRELLELIQNADDAGAGFPKPTEMSVLVTERSLLVANTGNPIGPEGIKSIMLSDNSPKLLRRSQVTGRRGVGFRALLGSASAIVIVSGRLSVGFSRENSLLWSKRLAEEDASVREKLARFEADGFPVPAPMLSVPFYFHSRSQIPNMDDDTWRALEELRSRYDTVVCLIFDQPEVAYRRILGEVARITPQVLIYQLHVKTLEITTPQATFFWTIDKENLSVTFQQGTARPQVWRPQHMHRVCVW